MAETLPQQTQFTFENWQGLVLETVNYPRPADAATTQKLIDKMMFEAVELILKTPGDLATENRVFVLSPAKHQIYFPSTGFHAARLHPETKTKIAEEFGDITWCAVALMAEKDIDLPEVRNYVARQVGELYGSELPTLGIADLEGFNQMAAHFGPKFKGEALDENPFVYFTGHYLSQFARSVAPNSPRAYSRDEIVQIASNLLWATVYLLNNYTSHNLEQMLIANYDKIQRRIQAGVALGEGTGTDHHLDKH